MSAYIKLAEMSLAKEELGWPSRPKFHVPSQDSKLSIWMCQAGRVLIPKLLGGWKQPSKAWQEICQSQIDDSTWTALGHWFFMQ